MENKDNWIVKYQHGSGIYLPFNEEKQYFPVSYEIVDMLRERDTLRTENERLTAAVNHAELARLTKDDIINVLRDDIKDRAADAARLAEENERLTAALVLAENENEKNRLAAIDALVEMETESWKTGGKSLFTKQFDDYIAYNFVYTKQQQQESDTLRAENERLYNEIGDTEALKVENARLTKQAAEDSIKLLVFNEVVEERDAAIAALEMLRTSITQAPGMQSQEDNWMLGIIDTALGDGPAADRPHPLAPVEVQ